MTGLRTRVTQQDKQGQFTEVRRDVREANKGVGLGRGSGEIKVTFLIPETKQTREDDLREEGVILAHGAARGCSGPWLQADHHGNRVQG